VSFEFLHPRGEVLSGRSGRANNRSCVLRIEARGGRVLLTGDIERATERELPGLPALLTAEALLAPHHGSGSSSSPEFVNQVAPRYAIFSAGYRNRFGHPRNTVLARYREAGSELLRTDLGGAIRMRLEPEDIQIEVQRERSRRYWHE
jgi:competence protein ComEC